MWKRWSEIKDPFDQPDFNGIFSMGNPSTLSCTDELADQYAFIELY